MKNTKNRNPVLEKKTRENTELDEIEKEAILNDEVEELHAASDSIEIEIEDGERITYGSTFSYQDGDLGDESEDVLDLPEELRKIGHRYDPTLSDGRRKQEDLDELETGIDIVDSDDVGFGYSDNDYSHENLEEEEF